MDFESKENKAVRQFEILRDIAVSITSGDAARNVIEKALRNAGQLVGLTAGSLILWDNQRLPAMIVSYAGSSEEKELLNQLEEEVFYGLRQKRNLVSAFLSLGGDNPLACFTQPVKKGDTILGAVIGIRPGDISLIKDENFLEALTAAMTLSLLASGAVPEKAVSPDTIKKERLNAIIQTAATVNHEINNPLTAVLGNIQLLLMRQNEFDDELVRKLRVVEESALRIKEVTQKLMHITSDNVTEYTPGSEMIDLSEEENSS